MRKYTNRIKLLEENIPASENYTFDDAMKEVYDEATKGELSMAIGFSRSNETISELDQVTMQDILINRATIKLKERGNK